MTNSDGPFIPSEVGEMDIHQQEATYRVFTAAYKWFALHLAALLIFLVLLTCTPTGWIGSLVVGAIIAVSGSVYLRSNA